MNNYSPLLINEPPLLFIPSLAKVIGLNEAIVVQQLHYWLNNPNTGIEQDGYKWVFNTYEEWAKNFTFWSTSTIQRIFANLEKSGVVITAQLKKNQRDMTKYYRIDYVRIRNMHDSNLTSSIVSTCDDVITETTIPETTENKKVILKGKTVRKVHVPRVNEPSELFEKDEVPTRSKQADEKIWKAYLRIHEIAGLGVPRGYRNKEEKPALAKALIDGIDAERLGIGLQRALDTDEPKFWPINRVINSLHILEAIVKPTTTKKNGRLTQEEIEDSANKAWAKAFGGALVCDQS